METPQQARADRWDRWNHNLNGDPDAGYAVCSLCGCLENSHAASIPCISGPVRGWIDAKRPIHGTMEEESGVHP